MTSAIRQTERRFSDNLGFDDLLQERDVICESCELAYVENLIGERGQTYYTEFWESKHTWTICCMRTLLKKYGDRLLCVNFVRRYLSKRDCL